MSVAAPVLEPPQSMVPRRRHLHLVPAAPAARRADGVRSVRLTVRGRRVLLGLVVAVALLGAMAVTSVASGTGAPESVTVQSGQTLSDVATQHLPQLPMETAVAHLQIANQLNSMQVSTGQRLVLPSP